MIPIDCDLDQYSFDLPPLHIAQYPTDRRDQSKLLRLSLPQGSLLTHHLFEELPSLLPDNCALIVNNTKVIPSRLKGARTSGGAVEATLIEQQSPGVWKALVKRAKRLKTGEVLSFGQGNLEAIALGRGPDGSWLLEFEHPDTLMDRLERYAYMPLPPYIHRAENSESTSTFDHDRYQTCFAQKLGAVAAPTAGLHFTPAVMEALQKKGIPWIEVTLHVGAGTFTPIRHQDVRLHQMHHESFAISQENGIKLKKARSESRKIIAVGTTSVRVLESLPDDYAFGDYGGTTNIFIYPPYSFRWIDGLITNFHLSQSSLLLLVSALCGRERLLQTYQTAIEEKYRFFSYGDCMLIL